MADIEPKIRAEILEDAYDEAQEWGLTRWRSASRLEPGYWSDEVDLDLTLTRGVPEPGEDPPLQVVALAKVGRSVVFHRTYDADPESGEIWGWSDV